MSSGCVARGSADLSNVPGDAASVERLGRQISQEELDLMGEDQIVQLLIKVALFILLCLQS